MAIYTIPDDLITLVNQLKTAEITGCNLMRVNKDPAKYLDSFSLDDKPTYLLFNQTVYYLHGKTGVQLQEVKGKNLKELKALFPKNMNAPAQASKNQLNTLTLFTGHLHDINLLVSDVKEFVTTINKIESAWGLLKAVPDAKTLLLRVSRSVYNLDINSQETRQAADEMVKFLHTVAEMFGKYPDTAMANNELSLPIVGRVDLQSMTKEFAEIIEKKIRKYDRTARHVNQSSEESQTHQVETFHSEKESLSEANKQPIAEPKPERIQPSSQKQEKESLQNETIEEISVKTKKKGLFDRKLSKKEIKQDKPPTLQEGNSEAKSKKTKTKIADAGKIVSQAIKKTFRPFKTTDTAITDKFDQVNVSKCNDITEAEANTLFKEMNEPDNSSKTNTVTVHTIRQPVNANASQKEAVDVLKLKISNLLQLMKQVDAQFKNGLDLMEESDRNKPFLDTARTEIQRQIRKCGTLYAELDAKDVTKTNISHAKDTLNTILEEVHDTVMVVHANIQTIPNNPSFGEWLLDCICKLIGMGEFKSEETQKTDQINQVITDVQSNSDTLKAQFISMKDSLQKMKQHDEKQSEAVTEDIPSRQMNG